MLKLMVWTNRKNQKIIKTRVQVLKLLEIGRRFSQLFLSNPSQINRSLKRKLTNLNHPTQYKVPIFLLAQITLKKVRNHPKAPKIIEKLEEMSEGNLKDSQDEPISKGRFIEKFHLQIVIQNQKKVKMV